MPQYLVTVSIKNLSAADKTLFCKILSDRNHLLAPSAP